MTPVPGSMVEYQIGIRTTISNEMTKVPDKVRYRQVDKFIDLTTVLRDQKEIHSG